ncbi:protein-glutamate O-methyltransferase [Galendromus occidentalis]|uniref:Sugar phosphate phosphatase n=1 Tax=Galendromus occidentalis TaxID=34638 RepID=A0AAJ6QRU2_9ACAR|nr:protein-glutamate O-methyltransferase [Galendromus occidentalis]
MAAPTVRPAVRLSARFESTFAYKTIKDRLPVILTKVIDHLSRRADQIESVYGSESREEVKQTIGRLSKLRNELQTNKDYISIEDSYSDSVIWNEQIPREESPRWFEGSWLFAECYFYRRIFEAFQLAKHLERYDYFSEQKQAALTNSMTAIHALTESVETTKIDVETLWTVSLWGNKCDLSLSNGQDNSQEEDPILQLQKYDCRILHNDIKLVAELVRSKNNLKLAVILDNAGFELVTDLILLDHLTSYGHASEIRLYVKMMPWFVSDALTHDVLYVIDTLEASKVPSTAALGRRCKGYLDSKQWTVHERSYWTLPYDYSEMKEVDPKLYDELSGADLLVFKGDLNYRKLVGDRAWKVDIDFQQSLLGFRPSPLVTLRTIKADTVTGLEVGVAEKAASSDPNWMITGEFAVVQYVP